MNYAQITSLFRVEERPVQFAIASVANVVITIGATIALVVGAHKGAVGAVVGNFVGTLAVYVVLLGYRRFQLGFQFDRRLLRAMNRFGLPLVPAALALWVINLIDRLFINAYKGQAEVGIYSLAVRISSLIIFLMTAFQLAWPAFAYSIRDDSVAQAHLLLRPHLPALRHLLDVARARGARALDRRDPRPERPFPPLGGGRADPLLRDGGVLGLLGARDRDRADAADAAELGRQRHGRTRQHRAQLHPDPALRDDGGGDRDARRLRRPLPRHVGCAAAGCTPSPTSGAGSSRSPPSRSA